MTEPNPNPNPNPAPPWHAGIETDTIGWWQNKGYDVSDPKALAGRLTQQYRDLEKHIGVPADRIVKLPEKADDEAGWSSVWQRLGAPKEAKEYDFGSVKHADGKPPEPGLIDAIRSAAAAVHAPKDRAAELATVVVKHLDGVKAKQNADYTATLETQKSELAKNWGNNFDFNMLAAMKGAKLLGLDLGPNGNPAHNAAVNALEHALGYSTLMDKMRLLGASANEDIFVEGRTGHSPNVTTLQGALARRAELMADDAWGKRLLANDAAAVKEFNDLSKIIAAAA